MENKSDVIVGIGGAAGDGLDKTGDAIAKTCSRLGLYVCAYNSYQSVIRGGHIWLRVRISERKVSSHGDHLNVLIALNQDAIERHAREVEPGGAVIYNADKLTCDSTLISSQVLLIPLPIKELTKSFGRLPPIMQNTVALGALLYLLGLEFEMAAAVLADTFKHKGEAVVDQNVRVAQAGYDFAKDNSVPLGYEWNYTRIKRPFMTGNEAFALGAVAAGCKFYSAYPMTPASSILHWMAAHGAKCGVVVKQCEDELAVVNIAIGAGHAGVRAMCGTSGGGFALMTEAIGQAGMIEAPVVIIEVQRGGPSTGIPTKTEQADLNQVFGASQGDYPRVIIAPTDTTDCYYSAVEAHNLAEKYQLPVTIISDLLLSEHPETIEAGALRNDVPIERGEIVSDWSQEKGQFKRYAFTRSGVSPRALPGTEGAMYVAATDDHDEEGVVISDVFTSPPVRRKIQEKRMRKLDKVLQELAPPRLEGPPDADVTLIGWGSTKGVIGEAITLLAEQGIRANHLQVKYLYPFHASEVSEILRSTKRTVCVECNYTGQFARHLRAETGFSVNHLILKYDGEPFEPHHIVEQLRAILEDQPRSTDVTLEEAREMSYHYVRVHLADKVRPGRIEKIQESEYGEPLWTIEMVARDGGEKRGVLCIGTASGSTYSWQAVKALAAEPG
jgi:2-oxoglutarate/2-oxoacid ferredoxin oxidoreductase subunit alpha